MDWTYVTFVAWEGALGIVALLFPVPLLAGFALPHRRLVAAAPGLLGAALFAALAIASGLGRLALSLALPAVALLASLALVVPSIRALRQRWAGLLHLLTGAGLVFTGLVAAFALSHDWP